MANKVKNKMEWLLRIAGLAAITCSVLLVFRLDDNASKRRMARGEASGAMTMVAKVALFFLYLAAMAILANMAGGGSADFADDDCFGSMRC
jgi:hypothetical protein